MLLLKKLKHVVMMAVLAGFALSPLVAHADGTPEEAKEMALAAGRYVREHGKEAAYAKFNEAESEFVKDDLYVFAMDSEGVFLAHPVKAALVGRNMIDLKDVEGNAFIKMMTEVKSEGWVEYKWAHPGTKKIQPKKSYVINIDGDIVGVGAYYDK